MIDVELIPDNPQPVIEVRIDLNSAQSAIDAAALAQQILQQILDLPTAGTQNLEQVTAEGAETTTPILVKNEDNSRAIQYRSNGFAILADSGNKAILFEAETPTGITGTGKAVLKDVGDDVKTIAYEEEIILALTTLNGNINDIFNYAQTHIENANNPHETDLNQILAQGFIAINKALKLKYNFGDQDVLELKPDAFSMYDAAGIVMLQMYKNAFLAKNHSAGSTKIGFQSTTSVVEVMFRNLAGTVALLSDINNYYKGTYSTLSALNTAHPSSTAGSYAIVDGGIGVEPIQYLWDANDNEWVAGSSSSPTTTDDLTEGTGNLYFTNARAVAALASALALKANIPQSLIATSNIVLTATTAFQKITGNVGINGDGSFNVEAGKTYNIKGAYRMSGIGGGSFSFGAVTDGIATFSDIKLDSLGVKATNVAIPLAMNGFMITSFSSTAPNHNTSAAAFGYQIIDGVFTCVSSGKMYPAVSISVAHNGIVLNCNFVLTPLN